MAGRDGSHRHRGYGSVSVACRCRSRAGRVAVTGQYGSRHGAKGRSFCLCEDVAHVAVCTWFRKLRHQPALDHPLRPRQSLWSQQQVIRQTSSSPTLRLGCGLTSVPVKAPLQCSVMRKVECLTKEHGASETSVMLGMSGPLRFD